MAKLEAARRRCAFRRSRPAVPIDRDQGGVVLTAPLDDGGDVSLLFVGQARREVPVDPPGRAQGSARARETVWVRTAARTIEVFHRGERVAAHIRSSSNRRHTTVREHMPSSHRRYAGTLRVGNQPNRYIHF
jgi:hypothetical protein